MGYRNLQECVADLEQRGMLKRIEAEIDPNLEMGCIQRRVYESGGPALLFERPADGTGAEKLLAAGPENESPLDWSPDGRHILFDSTRENGLTGIYVMDPDGSNVVRVTFLNDDWGGSCAGSNSAGRLVAYGSAP